jgi:glycosyltransferase involved in cell wall biosynthesis
LNVLYYFETTSLAWGGGVSNVAYYLPKALAKEVNVTYFPKFELEKNYLIGLSDVFKKFVTRKFDILHYIFAPVWINGGSTLLKLGKYRGSHSIMNIHGITQLEHKAFQRSLSTSEYIEFLNYLRSANVADKIVVNTECMRNNVVVWYGIHRDKVAVIPNGVDLKMFAGSNGRIMLEGDPSVLYVGHLSRLKGVDILIQAITKLRSELPNIKLHLVGGGNDRYFALLAKKEGIEKHVVFHGWTEHSMLPSYFKSADICVFPSRQEGFGIVILEAMASGIPVIASNIPSFQEIISNGRDGRLFKPEDADALSKEVVALYQDPHLRKELSRNAFEKVARYSWENIADKYISLYKCLLE